MTHTNYAVPPGAYLEEWIDENGLSQQQVADRMACSRKQINEIVNGRAPVTAETAMRLQRVVGIPVDSWLRYEAAYRADLARLIDEQRLAQHIGEIDAATAKYLRSLNATTATRSNPGTLVSDFLTFHRCGTWDAYVHLHEQANQGDFALAALKESRASISRTLLSTWLRAGEVSAEYEHARNYQYEPSQLRSLLPSLRGRVAHPDNRMISDVARMLAEVGVAFIIVQPPTGFPLYGMTRWIDKRVPVIQQTGRWGKDGFVIWTLFHEIGHVLNDPRGELHLEFNTHRQRTTAAEKGANSFARETLFGPDWLSPFHGLVSNRDIRLAAERIGISPGVAVQQLHRHRLLDYRFGNQLLVDMKDSLTRDA